MSYWDFLEAEDQAEMRLEGEYRRAAMRYRLRQAGLLGEPRLSRARCWLLRHAGRSLVSLGERLEQYSLPQAPISKGHMSGDA